MGVLDYIIIGIVAAAFFAAYRYGGYGYGEEKSGKHAANEE